MTANPWQDLQAELDRWGETGRTADFWWRDDDAVKAGPILDRLAETAGDASLSLAVIPDGAEPSLVDTLNRFPCLSVIQHGFAHRSHAKAGEKKCEFPGHRDATEMLADLADGREKLSAMFGGRFRPALAPPWNRIADGLPSRLEEAGILGLSTYRRKDRPAGPRLWVDTHCDIIAWRTTRGYVGDETALALVTSHLRERRMGQTKDEPTGIMTHHLVHDEACWTFLRTLVNCVANHPAAAWCDPFSDFSAA